MRFRIILAAAAMALIGLSVSARAQDYPSKPITFIVPSTAGGAVDLGARLYADVLARNLGQRFIVENRAAAGGVVAAEGLIQSPPDGYTLMITLGGMHEVFSNFQQLPFDPIKDFQFLTTLFFNTTYIMAPGNSPANSLAELAELGRKKPGGLSFGLTQLGSQTHLMAALFKQQANIPVEFVAYRGPPEMTVDVATGRLDAGGASMSNFRQFLPEKKIKLLAINAPSRSTNLPDVPTLSEAGYASIQVTSWFGLVVPAKTPPALANRIHAEFIKASKDPELLKKFSEFDLVVRTSTPQEITAMVTANRERLGKVIKELDIKG